MDQFTREQASEFYDAELWAFMGAKERACFQMQQDRLCMPFSVFQEAVETTLDRPVFTHEFAFSREKLMAGLVCIAGSLTREALLAEIPMNRLAPVLMKEHPCS